MKNLIAAVLLLGCGSAQAATTTLDFNDLPDGSLPDSYHGYALSSFNEFVLSGSVSLGSCCGQSGAVLTIANEAGLNFSLDSIWLGGAIFMQGFVAGGDTVTDTFFSFNQLVMLDSSWSNLTSVVISDEWNGFSYGGTIDDITLTAVPIPAAVWLFGSGLGLLGFLRRRKLA